MKLHSYQQTAVDFILQHKQCALFLDMGLGKTVTTLTAIAELIRRGEAKKVLVIAPLRVAQMTWSGEIEKWDHLKELRIAKVLGAEKKRLQALATKADIYIINRELVDWLTEKTTFNFDMVVIDELSSFKSWRSSRFKALKRVRPKINRMVGLTGTPAPNSLIDLWAQFYILDGGVCLGKTVTSFLNVFFYPAAQKGMVVFKYALKENADKAIYKRIEGMTLSMSAIEHLDVPPIRYLTTYAALSKKEQKIYDELEKESLIEIGEKELFALNAAALTNKLLQLANGQVYDERRNVITIHQQKLDALQEIIETANGHTVLVAYNFQHDLTAIQSRFKHARLLKAEQDFSDWNKRKIELGLIHPAAAGHGLNLQHGGNILVWYGLTWSLELYQQTNARLWRQGQKNGVTVQHIVARRTVDEEVMRAIERKDINQMKLLEGVKRKWSTSLNR